MAEARLQLGHPTPAEAPHLASSELAYQIERTRIAANVAPYALLARGIARLDETLANTEGLSGLPAYMHAVQGLFGVSRYTFVPSDTATGRVAAVHRRIFRDGPPAVSNPSSMYFVEEDIFPGAYAAWKANYVTSESGVIVAKRHLMSRQSSIQLLGHIVDYRRRLE